MLCILKIILNIGPVKKSQRNVALILIILNAADKRSLSTRIYREMLYMKISHETLKTCKRENGAKFINVYLSEYSS